MVKINLKMDQEIKYFHEMEDRHTEYLLSKYFSKDKKPTCACPKEDISKLFSEGVKKWGILWSKREYELRRSKKVDKS